MKPFPKNLFKKLETRNEDNALRVLSSPSNKVDFYSNDYLGFSKSEEIQRLTDDLLKNHLLNNSATGSRLISGNHSLYPFTENQIATFHNVPNALIFNSGYNANVGFFASVPQRGDVVFYDELIHASIRDGMTMSLAKNYKFKHNDLADLQSKVSRLKKEIEGSIYVVTESVFSMDGDSPDLVSLADFCENNKFYFIVDGAHALGVFGDRGEGLVHKLGIQNKVFATIVTFGKGLGCHGAAVLGSDELCSYLVNFARSFIYTTGLPPHAVATISAGYTYLTKQGATSNLLKKARENIAFFKEEIIRLELEERFIYSDSAIHCCMIPGNDSVKLIAKKIQTTGLEVKPILSPTVAAGQERLRICLHSYNTKKEMTLLLKCISDFM